MPFLNTHPNYQDVKKVPYILEVVYNHIDLLKSHYYALMGYLQAMYLINCTLQAYRKYRPEFIQKNTHADRNMYDVSNEI